MGEIASRAAPPDSSKKALLAKTEKEMKLVKLEKELAEKKQMLERLVANKHAQEAQQKQREDRHVEAAVALSQATCDKNT